MWHASEAASARSHVADRDVAPAQTPCPYRAADAGVAPCMLPNHRPRLRCRQPDMLLPYWRGCVHRRAPATDAMVEVWVRRDEWPRHLSPQSFTKPVILYL